MRARRVAGTPEARFWPKVQVTETCWVWTASRYRAGYGQFRSPSGHVAHRFAYELLVGPIPTGMQIDHLCRNKWCVNPAHLEPVTALENMHRIPTHPSRRAACAAGHEYPPSNTQYRAHENARICITCRNAYARKSYHKRKALL